MEKLKLLLHVCCAPCSTSVIEKLKNEYDLTLFYFNPNIYPNEEFIKRQNELIKYIQKAVPNIRVVTTEWQNDRFERAIKGLEGEKEGGSRCTECFRIRLNECAEFAKKNGYDLFTTTMSVSPYKNARLLNELGEQISLERGVRYLYSDFKKQDGYLKSIQISKEYKIYRQDYCGCKYSIKKEN